MIPEITIIRCRVQLSGRPFGKIHFKVIIGHGALSGKKGKLSIPQENLPSIDHPGKKNAGIRKEMSLRARHIVRRKRQLKGYYQILTL